MAIKNRFVRPKGEKRYKKRFILSVEGRNTEPQYFEMFKSNDVVIKIIAKGLSPSDLLNYMKEHLNVERLEKEDEAWIVCDKDDWTVDVLNEIKQWSQESAQHGFALSDPNFEYWLCLHFEDSSSNSGHKQSLKKHISDYDKDIDPRKFTEKRIHEAIKRASKRTDVPPCTTVYKLVEKLLSIKNG